MEQRNDELMHYGVPGMRWGVRRAKKAYAKAYQQGNTNKMAKLDSKLQKNAVKADRKVTKLQKKLPKLQQKVDKHIQKTDIKAAKLERKATKLENKAYKRFMSSKKAQKRLYESNKLQAKSNALKAKSQDAKAKLAKNQKTQELFKKGIGEMNALQVDKGRSLIKYASNIDKAKSDAKAGKISGREKRDIVRKNKVDRKTYLNNI